MNYSRTGAEKRGLILQERDLRLLQELSKVPMADREQVQTLACFTSVTRANARLLALFRAGYLCRRFTSANANARKAVYCLSALGAGHTNGRMGTRRFRGVPLEMFCKHELRITDFYIAVKRAAQNDQRIHLDTWHISSASVSQSIQIVPDGYFEIHDGDIPLGCFLEIDMGTETQKVWNNKVEQYLALARSNEYGAHCPSRRFRVLVVVPSERRLQSLRAATARMTTKIFWFATQRNINSEGVSSPIWLRPDGDTYAPLL